MTANRISFSALSLLKRRQKMAVPALWILGRPEAKHLGFGFSGELFISLNLEQ